MWQSNVFAISNNFKEGDIMNDYLNLKPEKGKWYISEGYITVNPLTPYEELKKKMINHNKGKDKMILAGPFTSKKEAKEELKHFDNKIKPCVWQKI